MSDAFARAFPDDEVDGAMRPPQDPTAALSTLQISILNNEAARARSAARAISARGELNSGGRGGAFNVGVVVPQVLVPGVGVRTGRGRGRGGRRGRGQGRGRRRAPAGTGPAEQRPLIQGEARGGPLPPRDDVAPPPDGVAPPPRDGVVSPPRDGVVSPPDADPPPNLDALSLDGGAPPPDGGAPPPEGGAPPPDGVDPPPDDDTPPSDAPPVRNRPERIEVAKHKSDYHRDFLKFMSWLNVESYDNDKRFLPSELFDILADDVSRYLNLLAYGDESPSSEARPIVRSSHIEYKKKALSFYMPNRLAAWNSITLAGNPTRSVDTNQLIRDMKTFEVRGQGVASQARRPIEESEWEEMTSNFQKSDEGKMERKFGLSAFQKVQLNMVARVDDTSKIFTESLNVHCKFIVCCVFVFIIYLLTYNFIHQLSLILQ